MDKYWSSLAKNDKWRERESTDVLISYLILPYMSGKSLLDSGLCLSVDQSSFYSWKIIFQKWDSEIILAENVRISFKYIILINII